MRIPCTLLNTVADHSKPGYRMNITQILTTHDSYYDKQIAPKNAVHLLDDVTTRLLAAMGISSHRLACLHDDIGEINPEIRYSSKSEHVITLFDHPDYQTPAAANGEKHFLSVTNDMTMLTLSNDVEYLSSSKRPTTPVFCVHNIPLTVLNGMIGRKLSDIIAIKCLDDMDLVITDCKPFGMQHNIFARYTPAAAAT